MLEDEIAFYEENKAEWLSRHAERFVLVKGRELVGVFNSMPEALSEGTRIYGLTSFLVRQVRPSQEKVEIPALTLGLLGAHS